MGFLFSPFGRVSLGQFWLYYLIPVFAATLAANIADIMAFGAPSFLSLALSLFLLWPSIAVPIKRFHDHGMTGWWVLGHAAAAVIAIVAGVFAFGPAITGIGEESLFAFMLFAPAALGALALSALLYLVPGRAGGNAHGPDPAGRAPALSKVIDTVYGDTDAAAAPARRQARRAEPPAPAYAKASHDPQPRFGRRTPGALNRR